MPVLTNLVYPAALTAFGLAGNAYILGNQIKDVRDDLGGQIKEIKGDLKAVKRDIKGLIARQTELELHDMSVAEKLLKDCGKNK